MNFLSVCSGIEAASVAWGPLGWHATGFSEIERFACAVLEQRYPLVPNLGDMTHYEQWPDHESNLDVLIGGTPCQSFSIAGFKRGLDDPRGSLMLIFLAIARRYRPRWVVWENVPGVLSTGGGRPFAALLGGLAQCGYGFAYRILDAQYFGVAQQRRRVFVVGYPGDWRCAAAVLFEPESLLRDIAAIREDRRDPEYAFGARAQGCSRQESIDQRITPDTARALIRSGTNDESRAMGTLIVSRIASTLTAGWRSRGGVKTGNKIGPVNPVISPVGVRRLTPRECERLQGFPDDYTLIDIKGRPAADSARYAALGNSMATPVVRWLGERIALVEEVMKEIEDDRPACTT